MYRILLGCLLSLVSLAHSAGADLKPEAKPEPAPRFLRLRVDKDGRPDALQTAVVTYRRGDISLDLIGAIHIGEKAYYRQLNRQMVGYDSLLYELVAPKGKIPDRKRGFFGMAVKVVLDLDSQTNCVDYSKKNFVHADLSFQEMKDKMEGRGEDVAVIALKLVAEVMQGKNLAARKLKENPLDAVEAAAMANELANAETLVEKKRALAKILFKQMSAGQGATMHGLLIVDRNEKAMEVFQAEIKGGKKKMGLFYGAAHMADFHKRLVDLGFKPEKGGQWLTAWDLADD